MNYPIKSQTELNEFSNSYIEAVLEVAKKLNIDLGDDKFFGDHLGLQVLSGKEFDQCHALFLEYSEMIHDAIIHDRRNRVYRFREPLQSNDIIMPRIEMFEPKPGADLDKLRPGIEHIAFTVKDYDVFLEECRQNNVPIDKAVGMDGSKFFKTKLIDSIEIEFRNDKLGE